MTEPVGSATKIPVICIDHSSVEGARIFEPNSWHDESKGVILSCWSEYSVLRHCTRQIDAMVTAAEQLCANSIADLQNQWRQARFSLERMQFFAQHADLHIRIEAFFSCVKSLLDLMVQLLSTEQIVGIRIDGFHRNKDVYGGRVLNALENNAVGDRKDIAEKVRTFVLEQKVLWIDRAISGRDLLVHPERGMQQLMFNLELVEKDGDLLCHRVHVPEVDSLPIQKYAERTFKQATDFSSKFLVLLGNKGSQASL